MRETDSVMWRKRVRTGHAITIQGFFVMRTVDYLKDLVKRQKAGEPAGICSVCTYNRYAVESAFRQALEDESPVLIESTSNQVNQLGGYTGMTPEDVRDYIRGVAEEQGFPLERLILGGDHLGRSPFAASLQKRPWKRPTGWFFPSCRPGAEKYTSTRACVWETTRVTRTLLLTASSSQKEAPSSR